MKVTTATDGTVTCELTVPQRKALASAHSVLEQLAFHRRTGTDEEPGLYHDTLTAAALLKRELTRDADAAEASDDLEGATTEAT